MNIARKTIKLISENNNQLFLYYDKTEAIILLKRPSALNDTDQMLFHDLIKQKLNLILKNYFLI